MHYVCDFTGNIKTIFIYLLQCSSLVTKIPTYETKTLKVEN